MSVSPHIRPLPRRFLETFSALEVTPRNHFRLHFFAAVHLIADHLRRDLATVPGNASFLDAYLDEMEGIVPGHAVGSDVFAWWDQRLAVWEEGRADGLPLGRLLGQPGLGRREVLALVLAGLVEEDARFGGLFGWLGGTKEPSRPATQVIGSVVSDSHADEDSFSAVAPLFSSGLLRPVDESLPRSAWTVRVPPALWSLIRGEAPQAPAGTAFRHVEDYGEIGDLLYERNFLERAQRISATLFRTDSAALIIRATPGSERVALAGAMARAHGRGLLEVDASREATDRSLLGPFCTLSGAVPAVVFDLGPGESAEFDLLPGYGGPLIGILSEGGLKGRAMEQSLVLEVPVLRPSDRQKRWEAETKGFDVPELDRINRTFLLPGLHLRSVAATAVRWAEAEKRREVTIADVRRAARALNREMLETLAERIDTTGSWQDLVVPEHAHAKLMELEKRCRHREGLGERLGRAFAGNYGPGVRALFTGQSGTGKTLAARVLASALEMDLYRVDLAAVINKYIGETEKNLHRVLSRAEELDVILLLDEGDALLGSRTDVRSANDRYANLETNYLLQRLENYRGIVVVTTNLAKNVDRAFQRRMDLVVEFPPPGPEERLHIWMLHLPEGCRVSPEVLEDAALRYPLSGGQIRNAALHAALLAHDGGAELSERHLREALESEYRKAGAARPPDVGARPARAGMQSFIDRMRR